MPGPLVDSRDKLLNGDHNVPRLMNRQAWSHYIYYVTRTSRGLIKRLWRIIPGGY